jgi:hypothetical protein
MKFPKYTNYMLILFLIVLSFILRYPRTPHSVGIDAFVMQGLANTIVADGYATWIIHPLSYLGLYPLSYPSGGIFLPAGLSVLSGYPSEISILALSFLMGMIGVMGSYLLAREFRDDDLFAFVVAFIFCLAPKFILNTAWETPTRGGFMAFTPFFLWALLRAHRDPSRKNTIMPIVILFALATFHRLAILMLIVILAYICAYFLLILVKIAKLKMPTLFLRPRARSRMRLLGALGLFVLAGGLLFGSGVLDEYESGRMVSETSVPVELFNLSVSITRSSGVLAPLVLVGALTLAYQRNKTLKVSFILFVVLAVIPTLHLRRYTGFYIPPFLSLLSGMGVIGIIMVMKNRKKATIAVLVAIVVSSLGLTGVLLDFESENTKYMNMEEYCTGTYAGQFLDGTLFWNSGLTATRVSAVSGQPYLPIGGATVARNGPEQLAFGFMDPEDVHVAQVPIGELTLNSDSPFVAYDSPNAQLDWVLVHSGIIDDPAYPKSTELREQYDIHYALESKSLKGLYAAWARTYYSRFLSTVQYERYKMFESDNVIIWTL